MNRLQQLKWALACLCLTVSTLASASVVYTWRTIALSPSISSVSAYLELTDAAVAAGHVSFTAPYCAPWPCDMAVPDSPILRFVFDVNNYPLSAVDIDPVAGTGYGLSGAAFTAEFEIVDGRLAQLDIFVNTLVQTLRLGGDTIVWFSSDTENCYSVCSGARGEFVEATIAEPATLLLCALAALGALLGCTGAGRPSGRATHPHTPN